MRRLSGKRYWLVGASEGLGRAVAHELSRRGASVVLTARNEDRLRELAEELPGEAVVAPADVSDRASLEAAVASAPPLDGVVFLAGVYWPFAATEWDAEKAEMMCDINFTGGFRTVGAALPQLLERNAGHIVITGSLSGFRGMPGSIGYSSSKAGVMHLAESLKIDLKKTGIDVQVINPGYIRTRLTDKNDFEMPHIMEPEEAAREMVDFMRRDGFKKSYPSRFALLFRSFQFLPDWIYYRLFS